MKCPKCGTGASDLIRCRPDTRQVLKCLNCDSTIELTPEQLADYLTWNADFENVLTVSWEALGQRRSVSLHPAALSVLSRTPERAVRVVAPVVAGYFWMQGYEADYRGGRLHIRYIGP